MTRIEDMSETERQSWITILADGAVFIYFMQKLTTGMPPRLVYIDMTEYGIAIIAVVIATVILHVAISVVFDMRKRKEAFETDERDVQIERKGAHWGYRVMQFGLGFVIITMFAHNVVGSTYKPPMSIEKPAEVIFALMIVAYVADLVKHAIMLKEYRG